MRKQIAITLAAASLLALGACAGRHHDRQQGSANASVAERKAEAEREGAPGINLQDGASPAQQQGGY